MDHIPDYNHRPLASQTHGARGDFKPASQAIRAPCGLRQMHYDERYGQSSPRSRTGDSASGARLRCAAAAGAPPAAMGFVSRHVPSGGPQLPGLPGHGRARGEPEQPHRKSVDAMGSWQCGSRAERWRVVADCDRHVRPCWHTSPGTQHVVPLESGPAGRAAAGFSGRGRRLRPHGRGGQHAFHIRELGVLPRRGQRGHGGLRPGGRGCFWRGFRDCRGIDRVAQVAKAARAAV